MRFRVEFNYRYNCDTEFQKNRYRDGMHHLYIICRDEKGISSAILNDESNEVQIEEEFFDDIIDDVISREINIPIGEFDSFNENYIHSLVYEAASKFIEEITNEMSVRILNISKLDVKYLREMTNKIPNELREGFFRAIESMEDITKNRYLTENTWLEVFYGENMGVTREQEEEIVQALKSKLITIMNKHRDCTQVNKDIIKAKLSCLFDFVYSGTWHFGLKREDGSVCCDEKLWPKPIQHGWDVTWIQDNKLLKPVLWFGPEDDEQINCWSIYGTEKELSNIVSIWSPRFWSSYCELDLDGLNVLGFTEQEMDLIRENDFDTPSLDSEDLEKCPIIWKKGDTIEKLVRWINQLFIEKYERAVTLKLLGLKEEDIKEKTYVSCGVLVGEEDIKRLKKELCKAFITYCTTHKDPKLIEFVKRLLSSLDSFSQEEGVDDTYSFIIEGSNSASFYMDNSMVRISSSGLTDNYPYWDRTFYANGETESDYDSYYSYNFDVFVYLNNKYVKLHIESPEEFCNVYVDETEESKSNV